MSRRPTRAATGATMWQLDEVQLVLRDIGLVGLDLSLVLLDQEALVDQGLLRDRLRWGPVLGLRFPNRWPPP